MTKDNRPVSYQQTLGTKTEIIKERTEQNDQNPPIIGGGDPNLSPDAGKPLK